MEPRLTNLISKHPDGGRARVCFGGRTLHIDKEAAIECGYANRAGEIVVASQFDHAGMFLEGLATVRIGGEYGYIDSRGRLAISPRYERADPLSADTRVQVDGERYHVDETGRMILKVAR